MSPVAVKPFEVLLVEDNPADVRLTQEAFTELGVSHRLHVAVDGVAAMAALKADRTKPDLVLLDLNLPKMDGREVLRAMKEDDQLRHIPVVILSTSGADQDVSRCYQLRANAFVTKPVDLDRFFEIVKAINDFWLSASTLWRL